jgi:hypothetical protein
MKAADDALAIDSQTESFSRQWIARGDASSQHSSFGLVSGVRGCHVREGLP